MAEGEFTLVGEHLEAAIHKRSQTHFAFGDHDVYTMLADMAAQQRDEAALQRWAPLADAAVRHYGHRLYEAIVHRAWGVSFELVGQYAEAEERLNQALAIFQTLDARWQIGRTYFALGELAAVQSDRTTACGHFAKALAAFETMKATPYVERARKMIHSTRC